MSVDSSSLVAIRAMSSLYPGVRDGVAGGVTVMGLPSIFWGFSRQRGWLPMGDGRLRAAVDTGGARAPGYS